ncbi:MAG: PaaI family thioesterase [Alphaproteobacteria bacterium]|nr:MAG: PaaI family thioesterase [Alphaproteobacteria bacterium]
MTADTPRRSDDEVLQIFKNAKNLPNSSKAVGFDAQEVNQAEGTITIAFEGLEAWTNPMGNIQGGFLCAMLDEAMTTAGIVAADFKNAVPTLEMKVSFLRPAPVGRLIGIGKAVRMGKSIAFLEGELFDANDKLVAKASATATPRPIPGRG